MKLEETYSWNIHRLAPRLYQCYVRHIATGAVVFKTPEHRTRGAVLELALDYMYDNVSYDSHLDSNGEFQEL